MPRDQHESIAWGGAETTPPACRPGGVPVDLRKARSQTRRQAITHEMALDLSQSDPTA